MYQAHPLRMEDFAGTCPLVPGVPHLLSGSCSSPRAFGWGFLQTPPHGGRPCPSPHLRLREYLVRGLAPRSFCAMPGTHARHQRRRDAPFAACRGYAAPDSSEDPLRTSTILPVTPPFPSNSCACLASTRGNRCAMSGLICCCLRRSNRAIKSCRNNAGLSRLSHWML